MGTSKKQLKADYGSVEQAGADFVDMLRNTSKGGDNIPMSEIPDAYKSIVSSNIPSMRQLSKEAWDATRDAGIGAGIVGGANWLAGSPVDPLTAAVGGGLLFQNVLQISQHVTIEQSVQPIN
jgi:hypothetical protein